MATRQTLEIMAIRYGADFAGQRQAADGPVRVGDTTISFHPAGHILGSAQIAVQPDKGPKIVVSGDYCRHPNPVSDPYEPVPCDIFVTEATFGLPVFRFPDPATQVEKLIASMAEFPDRPHLIGAYALGKAQHLIALMREAGYDAPIAIHGALKVLCDYYAAQGVELGELIPATADAVPAQLVIAPPSAFASLWVQRFRDPVIGFASGWMTVRARARQRRRQLPTSPGRSRTELRGSRTFRRAGTGFSSSTATASGHPCLRTRPMPARATRFSRAATRLPAPRTTPPAPGGR